MSTQLFPLNAANSAALTWSRGVNNADLRGSAVGWRTYLLGTARGTASTIHSVTSVTGPTAGLEAEDGGGHLEYVSPPIDADVTIAGSITVNIWGDEGMASGNASLEVVIERIDAMGLVQEEVAKSAQGVELTTTAAAQNFTVTPTSTAFHKGDRIRLRIWFDDASGQTMGSGSALRARVSGPTAGSNGDSYIQFTETFGFLSAPAGSVIYPTDTTSDVSTAAVDREAWTSRGAGVQNDVVNATSGWVTPIQLTDTAGGTVVDWWSRKLAAFTLGGRVDVNLRGLASIDSAGSAGARVELAVCASDGTGCTDWAGANAGYNFFTTEEVRPLLLAGDDLAVSDQQRLRLRLLIDDAPSTAQGTAAAMGPGRTVTMFYAGTSGGASGDSFLTFTQTLSEAAAFDPATVPWYEAEPALKLAEW